MNFEHFYVSNPSYQIDNLSELADQGDSVKSFGTYVTDPSICPVIITCEIEQGAEFFDEEEDNRCDRTLNGKEVLKFNVLSFTEFDTKQWTMDVNLGVEDYLTIGPSKKLRFKITGTSVNTAPDPVTKSKYKEFDINLPSPCSLASEIDFEFNDLTFVDGTTDPRYDIFPTQYNHQLDTPNYYWEYDVMNFVKLVSPVDDLT